MIVTIINGSPRGEKGYTGMMLRSFKEGVVERGGICHSINLNKNQLKMCTGCFRCWNQHNGQCVLKDPMNEYLKRIRQSDVLVLGTPLYYDNVSALLKIFLERLLPLHKGQLVVASDGLYKHAVIEKNHDLIIMASCDLPEKEHFSIVSDYAKKIAKNLEVDILAEIYKSQARAFDLSFKILTQKLLAFRENLRLAGCELVDTGKISSEIIEKISEDICTVKIFVESANNFSKKNSQIYFKR